MLASLTAAVLAVTVAIAPQNPAPELSADSLLTVMKHGGYTLLLRHARTDRTSMDEPNYSSTDRTTQRNLSGSGVADSKAIGYVMREAGIPFGEVVASPMFRTKETAEMAFGTPTLTPLLRVLQPTPEQRALVTKAPPPGTNRALVTHHFVIEQHVPGIRPGEIRESEGVVLRTGDQGEIQLVGRFVLADWERLSGGRTTSAEAAGGHGAPARPSALPTDSTLKPFEWTATPATRLAGMYLHAFNSGDAAQMHAFTEKSLVPDPNRTIEQRVEGYRSLFRDHGAFTIIGTERATATEAWVRVRSVRGDVRIELTVQATDSTRASQIRLVGLQGHP